ncbi:hypothetical protein [Streptomyces sp. KN37]|uniref:hypothetical protein n=1 Tax=Streptomyces sp. KN37 TaxID=3090667 RepID=UPI002A75EE8A|nr:hypothetical protein [Streptomyces sp. KN37]WPO70236.1 hypothetical protein R9806_06130 [Streptomyces sp. KN37]WPO73994.1 hypothetical protein R9806_26935 [Streptomyces sp. KN37]
MNRDAPATCTCCHSPLWDTEIVAGRYACYRCEDRAVEQLQAIRAMFKRLDTIDGLTKAQNAACGPTGTREAPIPARLAVLAQTGPGGVVAQLQAGIEDSWRAALGWTMIPNRTHRDIDGATTFLINNLPWACERYEEVADDLQAITTIHSRLNSLETGEAGPKKFTVYCDTDQCDGQLRITLWTSRATCSDCGTHYDKAQLAALGTQYDDREAAA